MRYTAFRIVAAWACWFVPAALLGSGCVPDRPLGYVHGRCPNQRCEQGEDPASCPDDCPIRVCGNNWCEFGENAETCSKDCPSVECGDGDCEAWENPYSCPQDCRSWTCGNGLCEAGESAAACPGDCVPAHCGNQVCEYHETAANCSEDCHPTNQVDVLLVVDDSQSMLNEQANYSVQFVVLLQALRSALGEVPDLHIGVVTTDLGTANYSTIRFCEEVGGDAGILGKVKGVNLGETCIGPGQRYIVDVVPDGCTIEKNPAGGCASHDCAQQHCDAMQQHNEVLTLAEDDGGCPRCRNFAGAITEAVRCAASVGPNGCGFEHQLEAMRKALDTNGTPENRGFLRQDSLLAVVFLTDEDDCSASRPDVLFNPDPAENHIDSTLGFLHSFRCFEFGITCDQNGRDTGPRTGCEPKEDDQALLYPVSRYVDFLLGLRDPGRIVVAAIAGGFDGSAEVVLDSQNRPELATVCTDSTGQGSYPGIRLKAFVSHFAEPEDLDSWAFYNVCAADFSTNLTGVGKAILERLGHEPP